jgi:hypothetical protein
MLAVVVGLVVLDTIALDLFFLLSSVGCLVTVEFTSGLSTSPVWRRRLRWLLIVLVLLSGAVLGQRILRILPSGVI